ncbi:MAG: hypothetical protein DYG88_04395 [Chloroflexi bacterium CFX4]|nr:hypothetical protein [Chloroflexi bacterium CFX4]MDL1920990.1 hypothetical protein [Chloroflexi bacterium CFX3]
MIGWLPSVALFAALIGYYATWINNAAAALSANAFDLAEWVGIIPAVRYADPPMVAPFALRLALVMLAWLFALHSAAARRLFGRAVFGVIGLALALSLRPPIAFFRGETADPNYQQLALLCFVALLGVALISALGWGSMGRRWWWRLIALPLGLIGILSALIGLSGALEGLGRLQIPTPLGAGGILYLIGITAYAALNALSALHTRNKTGR